MQEANVWVEFAQRDFEAAKDLWPKHFTATCFHLQQTWEKCLKAVLIARGEGLQKTHNIRYLATNVQAPNDWEEYYDSLTQIYVNTRYPTSTKKPQEILSENDVKQLLQLTTEVLIWTKKNI